MSGGVAYIYKSKKYDKRNFNQEMIEFENPSNQDLDLVKKLIENRKKCTCSYTMLQFYFEKIVAFLFFTRIKSRAADLYVFVVTGMFI